MTGPRNQFFSVEIHHGGYFIGSGTNRSYVDGSAIWFDQVDTVTWSPLMVENLVEEIGYEMKGRMKVHYLVPVLTMSNNGLRRIRDEHDTAHIVRFVEIGNHFISLFLDHDVPINRDDVVLIPVADIPKVITPVNLVHTVEDGGQGQHEPVPQYPEMNEEERAARRSGLADLIYGG